MSKITAPGIYKARLCDAPVVHDKGDDNPPGIGLQVVLPCEVTEGPEAGNRLTAFRTLVSKEDVVMLNEWSRLQEIFGTYLMPTEMFSEGQPFLDKTFEIDVQEETYNGETRLKVRWLNPIGGTGLSMPKPSNPQSVLAKYGSRFRALSGGTPVKAPAKPAAPALAKPATPPPPVAGPTATMQEAWQALWDANPGIEQDEATKQWQAAIAKLFGHKSTDTLTPQDWGKLKAEVSDNVKY